MGQTRRRDTCGQKKLPFFVGKNETNQLKKFELGRKKATKQLQNKPRSEAVFLKN